KEPRRTYRSITQALLKQQLTARRQQLTSTLQCELSSSRADIQGQCQSIGWSAFKSRILWTSLIGLSLCIGILGGSWGVMHYLSSRVVNLREQVQQGKTALEQLSKSWTYAKDKEAG